MDVIDCIRSARATRSFRDEPVPEEAIETVIECAGRAGSGKNRQPWSFVVVRDRDTLDALASMGEYTTPLTEAPSAVVIGVEDRETDRGRLASHFDCGRACQNLVLAARSLGLGTVPQGISDRESAEELLGFPGDRRLVVALAMGYPADDPDDRIEGAPKADVLHSLGRKPLEEILHWETHG